MEAVVAQREGVLQDQARAVIYLLRNLCKAPRPWQVEEALDRMTTKSALPLAKRILREHKLLFEE